jgi:hypothetical protein
MSQLGLTRQTHVIGHNAWDNPMKKIKENHKVNFLKKNLMLNEEIRKENKQKKMSNHINFSNSWLKSLNRETLYIEKQQIPIPNKSNVEGWNH